MEERTVEYLEAVIIELEKQVTGANATTDRYVRELEGLKGEEARTVLSLRKSLNDLTFQAGEVQKAQREEIETLKEEVKIKQAVIDRLIDESASIEIVQILNKLGISKPSKSLVRSFLAEFKSAQGDSFSLTRLHDQVEKFMSQKG